MSVLDRRTFLRGLAYGLLGAILGWEIEVIAAEAAPEEEATPCDSCIGLACSMCTNYDWYLYANPNRCYPELDAVRRAGYVYPWEGMPIRRVRPAIWACPRCKLTVSDKGQLCENCEATKDVPAYKYRGGAEMDWRKSPYVFVIPGWKEGGKE